MIEEDIKFRAAEYVCDKHDPYTLKHLRGWLDTYINGDTLRDIIYRRMVQFVAEDVEYYGCQAWTNVFDSAGCPEIQRQYILKRDGYV